jgi:hypothetical protein
MVSLYSSPAMIMGVVRVADLNACIWAKFRQVLALMRNFLHTSFVFGLYCLFLVYEIYDEMRMMLVEAV